MLSTQIIARRSASYLLKNVPAGFSIPESYNEDEIDIHSATFLHWDKQPSRPLGAYESCNETFKFATENDIFQYVKEGLNSILLRLDTLYDMPTLEAVNIPSPVVLNEDRTVNEEESVAPAGASSTIVHSGGFPLRVYQYYKALCDYSPRPDRDRSGQFVLDAKGSPVMRTDGCVVTVLEVGIVKQPEMAKAIA